MTRTDDGERWPQAALQIFGKRPDNELLVVELRGFEPLTFSLRTRRATNCATAPTTASTLACEHLGDSAQGQSDFSQRRDLPTTGTGC